MLKFKEVYGYDEKTFEYTGIELAQENPLIKGQFLIPPFTTNIKPLDIKTDYIIIWKDNQWEYIKNNKNIPYWLSDDKWNSQPRYMEILGEFPSNALLNPPEKTYNDLVMQFKRIRTKKLESTDYLVMSDYPLKESIKNNILEYRQKLRDMPTWKDYPWTENTIPWPDMPKY